MSEKAKTLLDWVFETKESPDTQLMRVEDHQNLLDERIANLGAKHAKEIERLRIRQDKHDWDQAVKTQEDFNEATKAIKDLEKRIEKANLLVEKLQSYLANLGEELTNDGEIKRMKHYTLKSMEQSEELLGVLSLEGEKP